MKLATLDDGTRDGRLAIVSRDNTRVVDASAIAPTLQAALDRWDEVAPALTARYDALCRGPVEGSSAAADARFLAPLPRAYHWVDGSAFLNHVRLVRRARGAEMPASFLTDPLVYQGGSDTLLAHTADIAFPTTDWGIDFEAEFAVVTGDVPPRTSAADAGGYVRLVMLLNDVSLRNLIPNELGKGFGFYLSKPPTAFAPFAVTPDELGDAWEGGRANLDVNVSWNGAWFGNPCAGPEMHFSFFDLIAHVTRTRPLGAGTIIGSGTVSNEDRERGSCCIAEKRMIEKIERGAFETPFMAFGDTVEIDVERGGTSLFGTIRQRVVQAP
ncbi:MAG: 2-keto-4-pentenoate hydratase [Deltaproteobacteria bacterium HGW-Deltaproteobacteria-14]|jgi:fumarylacetoacetate (FAA) hydrolase|nr:MAG: 2-keto-4-pentenoate hydratase [Deltaproteobacteria bacterium HGW-Deltaproteobacteria-14]